MSMQPPVPQWVNSSELPASVRQQALVDWNELLRYIEQNSSRNTAIVTGMGVTNTVGLTYAVAAGQYVIGGLVYDYAGGSITLDAASAQPRIDIITIDRNGTLAVTKGSAALSPATPAVVDQSVLALSSIYVQPSAAWFPAVNVSGTLAAAQIAAGSVDATKLNILQIIVVGLTITSNSPSAGKVAWSACTVYWNGAAYSISSGSTAATTNKFITWTTGATTFAAADAYTPADNIFLIATNTDGTGMEAWNKGGGTALSAVQKSNVAFALLEGFQIQPSAALTQGNIVFPFLGTASSFTANILTVNQACAFLALKVRVTDPYNYHNSTAFSIAVYDTNIYLRVSVDGATAQLIPIFNQINQNLALAPGADTPLVQFTDSIYTIRSDHTGVGDVANDDVAARLDLSCTTSLVVDLYCTCANTPAAGADPRTLVGGMKINVTYALKV